MKCLRFYLIFLSLFLGLTKPVWANYELDLKNSLEQLLEQSLSRGLTEDDLYQSLADHEKLFHFIRNYGSFLIQQIDQRQQLSGPQLNLIHLSFASYIKLTQYLLDQAQRVRPSTIDFRRYPQHSLIWSSLQIVLSERQKILHSLYFQENVLRRIIGNQVAYQPYEIAALPTLTDTLLNRDRAQIFTQVLQNAQRNQGWQTNGPWANQLIQSHSYQLVSSGQDISIIFNKDYFWRDPIHRAVTVTSRLLSHGFGALVGNIEWREGYLYRNQNIKNEVLNHLRPLDLIFEKKSFKLTDYTIPGNWGHVGVWLGTKEQLLELGLWDHPALAPFRERIEQGQSIYEVRRWGLQFASLDEFLNLDEMAISRVNHILNQPLEDLATIYHNLDQQWDKKYDYTFNALATNRTTCTEIIYLSYGHINWPQDRILGRTTITPDNMAELVLYRGTPMRMVAYYRGLGPNQIVRKNLIDYAEVLDYFLGEDGRTFEQREQVCQSRMVRQQGALRPQITCRNEYQIRQYTRPIAY